jgi:hypothetical protein
MKAALLAAGYAFLSMLLILLIFWAGAATGL